jgi:hypothetical protein
MRSLMNDKVRILDKGFSASRKVANKWPYSLMTQQVSLQPILSCEAEGTFGDSANIRFDLIMRLEVGVEVTSEFKCL